MKNNAPSATATRRRLRLSALAARLKQRPRRRPRSRLRRWFGVRRTTGFVLLAAMVALRIWDPAPLENLRLRAFDYYQALKPRIPYQRPVTIVDIDEASLRAFGQWPWPRTLVADMVDRLKAHGSVAIGFDVIFAERDRMSPANVARALRDLDPDTKEKLEKLPSNDDMLANALRGTRAVLGQSGILATTTPDPSMPRSGIATVGPDPSPYLITYLGLLTNVPVLEQAAAGRGLLTIRNERDGVVRRLPLIVKAGGIVAPALTLDILRAVTDSGAILVRTDAAGVKSVAVPGLEIPTDRNGQLWIHFGPHDPARYVSAKDLVEGRVPAERFRGKLVLIGTSSVGLLDIKTTPLDPAIPGVEIHAQVLESILARAVLSHPNWAKLAELAAIAAVGTVIAVLAPVIGAGLLFVLGAAIAAILIAGSWFLFDRSGLLLDFTFPLLASLLIYVTLVFISYVREQKDRRRIRQAFGQYLSPALVEQLAQSPEKLVLGGEERTMTVMFSDVRDFTAISESFKRDPQGLTQLMNRFLTPLTNAIIGRKGTIDKYMGDAIMAFWNAPLDDPDHEHNACLAALDMVRSVEELNAVRAEEARLAGIPFLPIRIGIGINTGLCVVGNMGSQLRFDYSVLGDPVNLASRIESRTKDYGVAILAGERTIAKTAGLVAALELDLITVKGKTEPERIYAIVGDTGVAASPAFRALQEINSAMLARFRARDWDAAQAALDRAAGEMKDFGLQRLNDLYSSRIRAFRQSPPADDWNGAFAFDTK